MKYSKNIKHGLVVVMRGDKIICASSRNKRPIGIYNNESKIKGFTLEGDVFSFDIPAGIRTYGEAEAKVAEVTGIKEGI